MWLYIPVSVLPQSAQASEDSISLSDSQSHVVARSCLWNQKSRQPRFWQRVWRTAPWLQRLSGMTCEPSTADRGVESWIASLRDYPASRTRLPASSEDTATSEPSGPSSCALSERCDPPWSSWRMSPLFSDSFSPLESGYRSWAIAIRQAYSARRKLAQATSESDSSAWPTPDSALGGRKPRADHVGKVQIGLENAASMWPTPVASDQASTCNASATRHIIPPTGIHAGETLTDAIRLWPTPRAEDGESAGNHPEATDSLTGATRLWSPTTSTGESSCGKSPSDSDLWPTPAKADSERGSDFYARREGNPTLTGRVRMWGTPRVTTNNGTGGQRDDARARLEDQAAMWSTPQARDGKGAFQAHTKGGSDLSLRVQKTATPGPPSSPSARTSLPRLNPRFVEWLLGLPESWVLPDSLAPSSLHCWATALYPPARLTPSEPWLASSGLAEVVA